MSRLLCNFVTSKIHAFFKVLSITGRGKTIRFEIESADCNFLHDVLAMSCQVGISNDLQ